MQKMEEIKVNYEPETKMEQNYEEYAP